MQREYFLLSTRSVFDQRDVKLRIVAILNLEPHWYLISDMCSFCSVARKVIGVPVLKPLYFIAMQFIGETN